MSLVTASSGAVSLVKTQRKLLAKLIPLVTTTVGGFSTAPEGSENFKICFDYILNSLKHHRFPGTNESDVVKKYRGLIEKFSLRGLESKSTLLENLLNALLATLSNLDNEGKLVVYDALALIIYLSDYPVTHHYESDYFERKAAENITWEDIIAEEPLTGPHWNMSSRFLARLDNDDGYLSEDGDGSQRRLPRDIDSLGNSEIVSDTTSNMQGGYQNENDDLNLLYLQAGRHTLHDFDDNDNARLNRFLSHQYWNAKHVSKSKTQPNTSMSMNTSMDNTISSVSMHLQNLNINSAISDWQKTQKDFFYSSSSTENYVDEIWVIRECLFMLENGCTELSTVTIPEGRNMWASSESENDDQLLTQINLKVSLRHVSDGCLRTVLKRFVRWGLIMARLRRFVDVYRNHKSVTMQAFVGSIADMIRDVDRQRVEWESWYQFWQRKESTQHIASIMEIEQKLASVLSSVEMMDQLLKSISTEIADESTPSSEIAMLVLTKLFDLVREMVHQPCFEVVFDTFMKTCTPYLKMVQDWIYTGAIQHKDFFIIDRRESMNINDHYFWDRCFVVRKTKGDEEVAIPSFLRKFMRRIFTLGKSLVVVRQMDLKKMNAMMMELGPSFSELVKADLVEAVRDIQNRFEQHNGLEAVSNSENEEKKETVNTESYATPSDRVPGSELEQQYPTLFNVHQTKSLPESTPTTTTLSSPIATYLSLTDIMYNVLEKHINPRYEVVGKALTEILFQRFKLEKLFHNVMYTHFLVGGFAEWYSMVFGRLQEQGSSLMKFDADSLQTLLYEAGIDPVNDVNVDHVLVWVDKEVAKQMETAIVADLSYKKTCNLFEALNLRHMIPPMLSFLFPPSLMSMYGTISRFLLQIHHSKWLLRDMTFLKHQYLKHASPGLMTKRCIVRMKLLSFVNALQSYVIDHVIRPESEKFMEKLKTMFDVDNLKDSHERFLRTIRDRCLLNEKAHVLLRNIRTVLNMCHEFSISCHEYDALVENATLIPSLVAQRDQTAITFLKLLGEMDKEIESLKRFVANSVEIMISQGHLDHLEALAVGIRS